MSEAIDIAPPSAPLALADANPALFLSLTNPNAPSVVTVPGNSTFALSLLNVTAIGTVKPTVAGTLTLTLLGKSRRDNGESNLDFSSWLPIAASIPEPIGGAGELPETVWMIRGRDLLINPASGKMQGTFDSNVADNPQMPVNLEHHPDDITLEDPLYIFAVAASFTPTAARSRAAGDAAATVTLHSLIVSD
jgi:hypothetical protein